MMPRQRALAVLLTCFLFLTASRAAAIDLYWIDTSWGAPKLNRSDENGLGVTTVMLTPGTLPQGLAAWSDGRLTWTEGAWSGARVMQSAYNLSGIVPIVTGQSSLQGVAVDNVNKVVYWTSSNLAAGGAIYRKTLNGAPTLLLALPPGANPRGIAVDPAAGFLFWADFDLDAIYRANLDGTGLTQLVSLSAGTRPWGVSVIPAQTHLFWTEYQTGQIQRCTYTGSNVMLLASGLVNPTYLVSDPVGLHHFWTDAGVNSQRIRRCNLNGMMVTTLPPTLATYGGIALGPGAVTGVPAEPVGTPLALARPWPLPAAGAVHLAFTIPAAGPVRLAIFDVQGREIVVPVNETMAAGPHVAVWDGKLGGAPAPVGVYFARLVVNGEARTERVVVAR